MEKLPELLLKVLENPFVAALFSGVVLIIISGADRLPFVSALSPTVKAILLFIGISLLVLSPCIPLLNKFFSFKESENKKMRQGYIDKIEQRKNQILDLRKTIRKIEDLVKSRDDEVSRSIQDILNGIESEARKFRQAIAESSLAAKWLHSKRKILIKSTESTNSSNPSTFCSEIEKYFELIVSSFDRGTYIKPEKRNITFHLQQPFPYIRALQAIKSQIDKELSEQNELSESEIKRLHSCIDNLIENIRKESSSAIL